MLNPIGPSLNAPPARPDDPSLALRLNQRIAAEVLRVSGDAVVLAINGTAIVARLANPDQAAALTERRIAQFIVRDLAGKTVLLQHLPAETAEAGGPAATPAELLPNLLELAGLPAEPQNVEVARALLGAGLPVTAELVVQTRQALEASGRWGEVEARAAANLVAAGLPLSPGTIEIAARDHAGIAQAAARLRSLLSEFARAPGAAALDPLIADAAGFLERIGLDWQADPGTLTQQAQRAAETLGRSLERSLAGLAAGLDEPAAAGMLSLARLAASLTGPKGEALQQEIDRFLDTARAVLLPNAQPETPPAAERWLTFEFPLAAALPPGSAMTTARLRVARQTGGGRAEIDAANTRLVIAAELDHGETVEVDLSIVARRIGARVSASSRELSEVARAELPALGDGLEQAGFKLETSRVVVKDPNLTDASGEGRGWTSFSEVNLGA